MSQDGEKDYRKPQGHGEWRQLGNQKQHYAVGRIKARNMFSETLLLFFGIHTANAAILAARQMARDMKKVA